MIAIPDDRDADDPDVVQNVFTVIKRRRLRRRLAALALASGRRCGPRSPGHSVRQKTSRHSRPESRTPITLASLQISAAWRPRRGSRCLRRLGHTLSREMRLTPSGVGDGVRNLAPPSPAVGTVRPGRQRKAAEMEGGGGWWASGAPMFTPTQDPLRWPVTKAAERPRW
jgi:hypothetical protein